tara:strand:+ start:225 stop:404 length:180 start_codon:yes stop_codon:yes gene_type:complete
LIGFKKEGFLHDVSQWDLMFAVLFGMTLQNSIENSNYGFKYPFYTLAFAFLTTYKNYLL